MNLDPLPVVGAVFEMGARDPLFDTLLLIGPVFVVIISLVGRTVLTQGMAGVYIAVFVLHIFHNFFRESANGT
jgi:hypothetical protein